MKKIENFIEFDDQEQKVQRENLTLLVHKNLWDSFPRVLPAFPLISTQNVSGPKYPKAVKEYIWESTHMTDLKEIKQTMDYIHPLLERWWKPRIFSNKAMHQLISEVLENWPHLLWRCFSKEEAIILNNEEKQMDLRFP